MVSAWQQIKNALWQIQAGPYPGKKPYSKKAEPARQAPTFFAQPARPATERKPTDRKVAKKFGKKQAVATGGLAKKQDPKEEAEGSKGETKERQDRGVGE